MGMDGTLPAPCEMGMDGTLPAACRMGMDGILPAPCWRPGLPRGTAQRWAAISTPSGSSRQLTSRPALALAVLVVSPVSPARPASPSRPKRWRGGLAGAVGWGRGSPGSLLAVRLHLCPLWEQTPSAVFFYRKGWSLLHTNLDAQRAEVPALAG